MANQDWQQGPWASPDFEQLAQRYWGAWSDAMRDAATGGAGQAGARAGMQAWHDAFEFWTRQAHGNRLGVNDAVERFNAQARDWLGQLQQIATRFAGQDHSARDIATAWREAMGASGENPFPEMFRAMRGHGLQGLDQWVEDATPYLESMLGEARGWLGMPAFGLAREHQERSQQLAQAVMEYQQASSAYNGLLLKATQSAFEVFERKLAEHEEPGRQIASPRALFDLWVDAAEESYAEIALSPEFRTVYGELVNSQMRVRAGMQAQVEQVSAMFDMPTRTELDGAHRKIVELERAVRRLRDAVEAGEPGRVDEPEPAPPRPAKKAARKAVKKAAKKAARSASGRSAPAKKAGARKTVARKSVAKKAAVKKTATKKAASRKKAAKKSGTTAGAARRREG